MTWLQHAFHDLSHANNNQKESISSFALKFRRWLDDTVTKMFSFAFHNTTNHPAATSNTEKAPLLGQGQHLFTLLKDH